MRILVTGGAGFIGSHLCDRLIQSGHEVTALDNFLTSDRANIVHLLQHPRFELLRHDVTVPYDVITDRIYNLASPASPVHYQKSAIRTIKANVLGAINCLELASTNNARVLQASTSEVYGDPLVSPQPETYLGNVNVVGPRSCYDEGKRCAETLMSDFHRERQVDVRIARIFNTFGPRMSFDDGRAISNFIHQALTGDDLTIYGDGTHTRSFCYVDDLVTGLIALMERPAFDGPVNLGSDEEITIRQLAETILRLTNSKSRIVYRVLPGDDPKQRRPDLTRAEILLGFRRRVALEDGLVRMIRDFEQRMSSARPGTPTPIVDPARLTRN